MSQLKQRFPNFDRRVASLQSRLETKTLQFAAIRKALRPNKFSRLHWLFFVFRGGTHRGLSRYRFKARNRVEKASSYR